MPPKSKTEDDDAEGTTPAEAAIAEVGEAPLVVEFRGEEFVIPRERFTSARWAMALGSAMDHKILYELVGAEDADRWVRLCKPGESFAGPAIEFFEAFNKVAGLGNS